MLSAISPKIGWNLGEEQWEEIDETSSNSISQPNCHRESVRPQIVLNKLGALPYRINLQPRKSIHGVKEKGSSKTCAVRTDVH